MKKTFTCIFLTLIAICVGADISASASSNGEDVQGVYEKIEAKGCKALDTFGSVVDIENILQPTKIKDGEYKVELTRKADHLYLIEGTSLYIEMKYCYEYAIRDKAILQIKNSYNRSEGAVYFLK